jgi:hypothetical protein
MLHNAVISHALRHPSAESLLCLVPLECGLQDWMQVVHLKGELHFRTAAVLQPHRTLGQGRAASAPHSDYRLLVQQQRVFTVTKEDVDEHARVKYMSFVLAAATPMVWR